MNSASVRLSMPMNSHPAALAACAVLAIVLNAGALGLATDARARLKGADAPSSDVSRRMAMVLIPAVDDPPPPAITRQVTQPAPRAVPAPARRGQLGLPAAKAAEARAASEPVHQVLFYTFREVDSPAFPESDWNLDVESLDQIGVARLAFEILVSASGEVVGCTVLEPDNLAQNIKQGLEARLSQTRLLPAVRAGQLVASVRRIELVVAATQPGLPANVPARHP